MARLEALSLPADEQPGFSGDEPLTVMRRRATVAARQVHLLERAAATTAAGSPSRGGGSCGDGGVHGTRAGSHGSCFLGLSPPEGAPGRVSDASAHGSFLRNRSSGGVGREGAGFPPFVPGDLRICLSSLAAPAVMPDFTVCESLARQGSRRD